MKKFLSLAVCCLGLLPITSFAQEPDRLADIGLERRIAALQSDGENHAFEIGMLQSLRAVEKTLQTRYEYGLGDRLVDLPVLRLQFGGMSHPQPKIAAPDTLSKIVSTFVTDLRQAQTSLTSDAANGPQAFEMTLHDLWFDIDRNGERAPEESAASILAPVILGQRAMQDPDTAALLDRPITIRFDAADHDWLLAYTHLLSGFGNAFLAFDPTPVIRDLADQNAILANAPEIDDALDEQAQTQQNFIDQATLDTIYLVIAALRQQPNPDHIRAARQDWQAMIDYNSGFWTKLALETDNDREWIPNPDQTSALPLTLPPGTAEAWQRILADAQSVLEGKLLIQHPFLPNGYGINAAAYFDDPSPLNFLDWLHGVGAYKYAARGPVLTRQSWRAFNRLTLGNASGFALFLN